MSIEADLGAIEGAAKRLLHIGQQQPAPPPQRPQPRFIPNAQSVPSQSSQPEVPVSRFTDIEDDVKSVLSKLGAVDKAAYEAIDELKGNQVAWSIFVSLATAARVPDPAGTLNFVDNLLKAFANGVSLQQVAQAAAQPQQPAQPPANGTQAAQARTPQVITQ